MPYFDPLQEKRIDRLDALKNMIAPYTGKIRVDRFDMIDPKVQHHEDVAVLTFNLAPSAPRSSCGRAGSGPAR